MPVRQDYISQSQAQGGLMLTGQLVASDTRRNKQLDPKDLNQNF